MVTILSPFATVLAECSGAALPKATPTQRPIESATPESTPIRAPTPVSTPVRWMHLSSADGGLPRPSNATQQTASLVLDVDKDDTEGFVIGSRRDGPSLVWYRRNAGGGGMTLANFNRLRFMAR
jgi:hypothetical protein